MAAPLRTFVLFLGHPTPTPSTVARHLARHPAVALAAGVDALDRLADGVSRASLVDAVLDHALVPREARHVALLADASPGDATRHLFKWPSHLDDLRATVGVPVKVIRVVHNPFDQIAEMAAAPEARGRSLQSLVQEYFVTRAALDAIDRQLLAPADRRVVRDEDVQRDPCRHLTDLTRFLGLDAPGSWLARLEATPQQQERARDRVAWTPGLITQVSRQIARHPELEGYRLDDGVVPRLAAAW